MMPFIQNLAYIDVINGNHKDAGDNAMLIQIVDPAFGFPNPKHSFKEIHQFEFLDLDDSGIYPDMDEFKITDTQAKGIVSLLSHAKDANMNVIVHCMAGICRSGAVVEAAIALFGFEDTGSHRIPNTLVKRKLLIAGGYYSNYQYSL